MFVVLGSATAGYLSMSPNVYLARWHMCLELFGRVFLDDVGIEPCSVLNELGRFDVKEVKFRREMEKLRNGHQKDLYLEGVRMFLVSLFPYTNLTGCQNPVVITSSSFSHPGN